MSGVWWKALLVYFISVHKRAIQMITRSFFWCVNVKPASCTWGLNTHTPQLFVVVVHLMLHPCANLFHFTPLLFPILKVIWTSVSVGGSAIFTLFFCKLMFWCRHNQSLLPGCAIEEVCFYVTEQSLIFTQDDSRDFNKDKKWALYYSRHFM